MVVRRLEEIKVSLGDIQSRLAEVERLGLGFDAGLIKEEQRLREIL